MGTKDKTFDSDMGEYIRRLQWAARKYVVFYDVGGRRGWLVDGATALLHLFRASLRFSSAEDVTGEFTFSPSELREASGNTTARSASIAVLKSPHNLGLRLYQTMHETFLDRVEAIYHLLEKVLAHQAQIGVLRQARIDTGRCPQGVLEGFDFMDLAGDTDNFRARMIDPSIRLPRWLVLAENLDAPVLFGREFGDLLQPCGVLNVCDSWTTVPLEKDYLAVRVDDIAGIMRRKGNNFWSPWRVINGIYWHSPDKLFENCPELRHKPEEKCNHAQVLVAEEEARSSRGNIISPARLEPQGAVIFDGSPVSPQSSSIDVPLVSTLAGSQSPDTDSGISVEYSPNSAGNSGTTTFAKGKRPMHTLVAPSDLDKRRCHGPSGISTAALRSDEVARFEVSCPDEPDLDLEKPNQSAKSSTVWTRRAVRGLHIPEINNEVFDSTPDAYADHATIDPDDYTVGWICALHVELNGAQRMLDRVHARGFGHGMDCNLYILGQIGKLNVVLTCLPKGQYGNNIAAVVATRMMNRFPRIEIGLMVGIGGGLPSPKNDIRLGDVVVSIPHLQYGGVVQYDMGKFTNDGFVTTGSLKAPPEKLLHVLNYMSAHGLPITGELEREYPGVELDQLFEASYPHVGGETCEACDREQTVQRSILRDSTTPHVFYGTIASGNSVIKDPGIRETLIKKHDVLCCEMEAAGLMNTRFPCLVIRGISDYADSHKNDIWIPYAAVAAAQYARDLLLAMPAAITLSDTVG
jgi:nucleoside phosphorylase